MPTTDPAAGTLQAGVHTLPLRVYYEDTVFSGVVYHASYLRFLERGRTEFIRALGIDQAALHAADGFAFVVRRMTIDWLRPARMDDCISIETRPLALKGASLELAQRVLVAGVAGGRPVRLPADLRRRLESAANAGS